MHLSFWYPKALPYGAYEIGRPRKLVTNWEVFVYPMLLRIDRPRNHTHNL